MSPTPSDTVWHTMTDEGAMLLDPSAGRCYGLNPTAATIWALLHTSVDVDEIASRLAADHDIGLDQARRDIDQLITELRARGLTTDARPAQ